MALDKNVLQGFRYRVIFSNIQDVGTIYVSFSNISGLQVATEVVEYREGDDPITMRKFPGLVTFDNITFEYGIVDKENEDIAFSWFNSMNNLEALGGSELGTVGADPFRADIYISIYGRQNTRMARRFILRNAFIASVSLADMDASSSDILIMSMEVAHEGFR